MLWIGKDYYNELRQGWLATCSTSPYDDYNNRKNMPRMPWQDISAHVFGGGGAADVARHFIERWNAWKYEKSKADKQYPFLLPKSTRCAAAGLPADMLEKSFKCRTQVLRSLSTWSVGLTSIEDSIHQAYVTLTRTNPVVKNSIADALFQRVKRAHVNLEEFHIYIMLPLLPAIQGQFGTPAGAALQMVVHYIYQSINRAPDSLFERLKAEGVDPEQFITFSSVRAHGIMNKEPVTEIVYVHSKLLIIDDYVAIIGSANINDRSMLGYRDSEVCILYRDEEFDEVELVASDDVGERTRKIKVGKFAGSLRRRLWNKYLNIDVYDARMHKPNDTVCVDLWKSVARSNTQIYQDVFTCVPSDTVRTYPQLLEAEEYVDLALEDPEAAIEKLKNEVQGYLVEFPLHFLDGEDARV